jgi:hypothetical protein
MLVWVAQNLASVGVEGEKLKTFDLAFVEVTFPLHL